MADFEGRYSVFGSGGGGGGGGTVTSVDCTVPTSIMSVSGVPIIDAGTIAIDLVTQSANRVWAGPTNGAAATPTFRALVSGDIPSLSSIYLPLAGGTMAGNIAMGSNGVTGASTMTSANFIATTSNVASTGEVRLSNTGTIAFRNAANNDNVLVSVRSDNSLKISGGVAAGADQIVFLQNSDNTNASSDAYFLAQVGGTSAGDPYIRFEVPGATTWSVGNDNSASQNFSITNGAGLGGASQYLAITTAGVGTFCGVTNNGISSNKVIVNTASVNGTATAIELVGGASSANSTVGGDLRLGGGAGGSGAEKGVVMILGTANSTGNRPCLVSQTDGVGFLGYNYAAGAYARFGNAYFKTGVEIRNSGGSGAGFNFFQDGTDSYLQMYRSTSSHGVRLVNDGNGQLSVKNEAGDTNFMTINQGNIILGTSPSNVVRLNNATQSTVGSAGGASGLPATPTGYVEVNINGTARVIPYYDKT